MDERDLVARAKAGCPDARAELVERHQRPLFAFLCRYVGQAADAEDLCQQVFLQALRNLNGFRSKSQFRTWLLAIAANAARSWRRDEHRRKRLQNGFNATHALEGVVGSDNTNADAAEKAESAEAVRHAVGSLPTRERTAILLRMYHELSYEEIATVMACSTTTVRNLLYRARRRLAVTLRPLME